MELIELGTIRLKKEELFYPIFLDYEKGKLFKVIDYYTLKDYPKNGSVTRSIVLEELDENNANYVADLFDFLLKYHIKNIIRRRFPLLC